jgi:hypothetical protein
MRNLSRRGFTLGKGLKEVVELDGRRVDSEFVDEPRRDVGREDRVRVGGRKSGKEGIESNFLDQDLGESSCHDWIKRNTMPRQPSLSFMR